MRTGTRHFLSTLVGVTMLASFLPLAVPGLALATGGGSGAISLTTMSVASTQDFNTLANTGTANNLTLTGWYLDESGSSSSNNGQYRASAGTDNAGDTYSYGAASATDRAFGTLFSGTLTPIIGAQLTNNTGSTLGAVVVSYTGEMWRAGVATRGAADRLDFQLSTNATSLTTGTYVNHDSLDYSSTVTSTTSGAKDGNNASFRTAVSATIGGLSIANGATFWIRWTDFDISSSDDGLAVDDFSITPLDVDAAPSVSATSPLNNTVNNDVTTNIEVTFSEAVTVTDPWFTISCGSSGAHTATVSGGPISFTLDPDTDFNQLETCTVTVVAANVTDQDANDPPDNMATDYVFSFKTGPECDETFTPVYQIQGSGLSAAVTGTVTTEGIVVGDFEGTAAGSGFYLQDATGDGDAATSDGIFVYTGSTDLVSIGQVVRVSGYARERFNQTTINGSNSNNSAVPATGILSCGTSSVPPTDVTLPFADANYPERYEGMYVRFPETLVIAEYFNYDRFGEIVLAKPLAGETRPFTGTAIDAPAPALARAAANALSRITLDDIQSAQNPAVLRHPDGTPFTLTNYFRGGDQVANATGVLGFDFSLYRIFPTTGADYTAVNPRPTAPEDTGGRLTVAAQNTLNFFVTLDLGSDICGPGQDLECRGADDATEFTRQRDKLLATLTGLDADVIGLNELENTTGVEPMDSIVAGLTGYDYIDTGTIGTDAIKVGLIYRTATVTPVGSYAILNTAVDPRFIDTKSRPVLAQTFMENATGEMFTVAVNHLKSKGSDCNDVGDPDAGDGQGNCNGTRTLAAQALVDWLATDPTASGDPDFLIIGDLNSYAMEDPITAIKAGADNTAGTADDYTNLVNKYLGTYAYSYVFDGQAGYLDHALSSTPLTGQVTGVAEWHINADEADVLDYDTTFKPAQQDALYEPAAYRSSDHDSILVGLNLQTAQLALGGAGCEEFADGTASSLSDIGYSVKKNKINGVNQGLFSYWVQVQAAAGANSFTINQAITTGNFSSLFPITGGSNVFRWDCVNGLAPTLTQSSTNATSGTVTVSFMAPSAGTYYLGLKFSTTTVKGNAAPSPSTVHYEFWTTGVSNSTYGLDLVRQ